MVGNSPISQAATRPLGGRYVQNPLWLLNRHLVTVHPPAAAAWPTTPRTGWSTTKGRSSPGPTAPRCTTACTSLMGRSSPGRSASTRC